MAIRAWNLMRGIDWQALPVIAEMLGIVQVDLFVNQLIEIRNFNDADKNADDMQ